mmetsp:Transcript_96663/g.191639  ORF Transcript_96663/g.191639 Transcript_96663/m.191639 type:complete len:201 (+) Transcript_96663:2026-2628(+)
MMPGTSIVTRRVVAREIQKGTKPTFCGSSLRDWAKTYHTCLLPDQLVTCCIHEQVLTGLVVIGQLLPTKAGAIEKESGAIEKEPGLNQLHNIVHMRTVTSLNWCRAYGRRKSHHAPSMNTGTIIVRLKVVALKIQAGMTQASCATSLRPWTTRLARRARVARTARVAMMARVARTARTAKGARVPRAAKTSGEPRASHQT